MTRSKETLLEIRNLRVRFGIGAESSQPALDGVSFRIAREAVGLMGASGSGKTTLALAIGGLLPRTARIETGSVIFCGKQLLRTPEREMRKIRGAQMSFIFQEPAAALNPVMRVGDQIAEVLRAHRSCGRDQRQTATRELLQRVHLPDTDGFYRSYPHEISGGQRQRVVIAQALACNPPLLIADEPTTALDTITQAEILGLLKELKKQMGLSLLIISHAPATLAGLVDRVLVMQSGRLVEEGRVADVFGRPAHPYTRRLIGAGPPRHAVGGAACHSHAP